jgi:hypothetical protein
MHKTMKILVAVVLVCGFSILPVFALEKPVVTLEKVEVASIQPFYVKPRIGFKSAEEPGKEETYGYSSTLSLAYVLNIKNPNKEALMLDELQFTAAFDGFEVNTVMAYEKSWIPGGKTNQVRVVAINEAFPAIVSLMVGAEHAPRIAEMKTTAGALVSKWWKDVSDFAFPITVTNGTAKFQDDKGKEIRATFSAQWPAK